MEIDLKFKSVIGIFPVNESEILGKYLIEYETSECCPDRTGNRCAVSKGLFRITLIG